MRLNPGKIRVRFIQYAGLERADILTQQKGSRDITAYKVRGALHALCQSICLVAEPRVHQRAPKSTGLGKAHQPPANRQL